MHCCRGGSGKRVDGGAESGEQQLQHSSHGQHTTGVSPERSPFLAVTSARHGSTSICDGALSKHKAARTCWSMPMAVCSGTSSSRIVPPRCASSRADSASRRTV